MFQHSPNVLLERCGDVAWNNAPASTSNLIMNIGPVAIRPGESVLYYFVSNVSNGSVTVSHVGLSPTNSLSFQPSTGGVMQGFALINYPIGLAANTPVTFSKSNFWGTHSAFQALRITNGFWLQSYGTATVNNYVTPNTTGITYGYTSGTQVRPGYKKSMATIVATACTGDSALTAISAGWSNFALRNIPQFSASLNGRSQAILPAINETFLAQYAANIANLHFMALRISS